MLTLFRDLVRSKVAVALIGLLILSLALFGVPDFFGSIMGGQLGNSLMRADSRTLEMADVDRYADRYIDASRSEGANLSKADLAQNGQLESIIGLLGDFKTRSAFIDKLKLNASQDEAADWLKDFEPLKDQVSGQFDSDLYAQFVADRGYNSKKQFEHVLMDDLTITTVNEGLSVGIFPTDGMSDLWSILKSETRNIAFMSVSLDNLPEPVTKPTEEDVKKFYDESQQRLEEPERRQFSVLAVTPEDFYHTVTVTDDDIKKEYDAQLIRFSSPGERTYQVLSFQTQQEAVSAMGFLLGGGDAATTSGALSDDITAKKADILDKSLAEAIFNAPLEIWQGPIQSSAGAFSLVRVSKVTEGERTPLESVKDTIRDDLIKSRAERTFSRVVDDIDDAVGAGQSLEQMAEAIGTPVYTYQPVDNRGFTKDGLFMRNLAMMQGSLKLGFELYTGEASTRQEGPNMHFIVRLDRIVEPTVPELEKIKEPLTEALFARKKEDALTTFANTLKEEIESGKATMTTAAEKLGVEVTRPPIAVSRTSGEAQGFPEQVLSQIFNAKLDGVFMAPLQEAIFIGVVEAINIPDENTLKSLRTTSEAELKPTLVNDVEDGFSVMATKEVKVQTNASMIKTYLDQYQATE